ncbi:MAG TPA: decaprenyl-phosphate phosphoribosyltransferase [Planctomycetes bacterium]|nr:decaprenyl-phosphate phosphoribosyltransferase [Planctomycetota bacterium]
MTLPPLIATLRPHQWVKNVFVGAALLFTLGELGGDPLSHTAEITRVALAVAAFCLASSSIYIINDVLDAESDRKHPEKCKRPIASGALSVSKALVLSLICIGSSAWLASQAGTEEGSVLFVVLGYALLNLLYSLRLKHIVLVDVFCIAAGFLLRVVAGAYAVGRPISEWLVICTFFLALFLALCKRHAELELLGDDSSSHRRNLREYSIGFLNQSTAILAACSVLTYAMYTMDAGTVERLGSGLIYTVPFVVFGIFRYLLLVQTRGGGGSPSKVLLGGDAAFALNGILWFLTTCGILFLGD